MKKFRNSDLYKEKNIVEGISEGKIKGFIFLFLIDLTVFSTNNNNVYTYEVNDSNDTRNGSLELGIFYSKKIILSVKW